MEILVMGFARLLAKDTHETSTIVYGFVGALALGLGLAIGLGGKDTAGKVISDMYSKTRER
jgi:hypothetical protein